MLATIHPPNSDEYTPYYARYIQRVPEGDILTILGEQTSLLQRALDGLSDDNALYRFAPDAWSIKEVVGHLLDVERVFSYRACAIARNDPANLPNFEQDDYVREGRYDKRTLSDLLEEFAALRQANLLTFGHIDSDISTRRGIVVGGPFSVRALLYAMAGHVDWHLNDLQNDYFERMRARS